MISTRNGRYRQKKVRTGGLFIFVALAGLGLLLVDGPVVAAHDPRGEMAARLRRCEPGTARPLPADECRRLRMQEGRRLFEEETFGGNGRTCRTCHSSESGTLSPEQVRARVWDLTDPLFRHDGLDDGVQGTTRIEQRATIRVRLPLPTHLTLADAADATHVVVNRGIPSTLNTPALDAALMWDLRDADLEAQAFGAIEAHAQAGRRPAAAELRAIAEFQRSDPRFFSGPRLRRFARTGIPPELPAGRTPAEIRGRLFFIDAPFEAGSNKGICALCHSGPMLNEANRFSTAVFNSAPGTRAFSVGVSEANSAGNPIHTFLVSDGIGEPVQVRTPDIGVLMTSLSSGAPAFKHLLAGRGDLAGTARLLELANAFKTPTLWGVKETAPYFHDNSAGDFDELLNQYENFFLNLRRRGLPAVRLSATDREDIKAYLKLL
jgi:hypothetical protein